MKVLATCCCWKYPRVNREVLDFVGSMTAPAEVPSSRAVEGQGKRSLVPRFLGWVRRIAPWLTF